jgi:hypothetical protein
MEENDPVLRHAVCIFVDSYSVARLTVFIYMIMAMSKATFLQQHLF